MNRNYRSLWNETTGTFVAVSEIASSAGKKTSSGQRSADTGTRFCLQTLAACVLLSLGATVYALPTGGAVVAGAASISTGTLSTTINQTTQNAAINWQSFNIASGEAVRVLQPNSSSVLLNRVLGSDPSNILGSLSANGKVFLVNPNGILFGRGASVNTAGLVASTLNVTDSDFMAGSYKFAGNSTASVLNQGSINADGGYVALLGASVTNDGVIQARLGSVALAAGNAMTLDLAGDGLLNVSVSQGALNALAQNGGLIQADGGQVLLSAQSAGALLQSAVNNTGVIQAQTLQNHNGTIKLMGDMQSGAVNVGGTLDASAPNGGNGGFVETSAAHVKVADGTQITTLASAGQAGTWLIDPTDFTVAALGGDITGALLGTNLDLGNVTLQSTLGSAGTLGNVNIDAPVSWTATTTLGMVAVHDVNINQAVSGINGSVNASAGHDVNVAAATKTTTGMLSFTAVNDVAISAATTISTGNLTAVAGKNVTVSAASTITTGDMILRADNDGTGPGVAAGTVAITCGSNCLTITTGNLSIRFNPVSYATTAAEITAYDANLTGAGVLDAKAWVFGKGDNKLYDGTTAATVSGLKPDVLSVAPPVVLGPVSNANFDNRNVGTSKPIIYNSTFTDAVYDLFTPFGATPGTYQARADILVRPLTVNAVTDTRVYNGTTSSTGTPTVIDLQAGDTMNGALTQTFASKNVLGTNASTLVATGPYTVADGNGGNNYVVTVNTAPGTITPLALVGAITAANKVYDGNVTATITSRSLATVLAGDAVSYVGGTAVFGDKNVANGKTVTGTGLSLGGADAGNYTVNTTATTTANITPAPLTIQANNNTKVYGTTFTPASTAFTTPVAPIAGETVVSVTEVSPAGSPATAAVPGPYPITPSAAAANGAFLPTNYTITYVNGALTVTPAPLVITANNASKPYGQTIALPGTAFTTAGLLNGNTVGSVTEVSPGTVATAPVAGSPYAITPSAATGGSFVATNYTISYVNGALTVTPIALTITASDATKIYGQAPILSGFTTTPLVNGESVTSVTETSPGQPANAAPGTTYPITASNPTGSTFTPSNYTIGYVDGVLTVIALPDVIPAGRPFEGPVVNPTSGASVWPPVIASLATPPQLLTLASPPAPVVVVPAEPPVIVQQPTPILMPVTPPPSIYVAPHRPRKQDRN
jgi:filamentous hemagglutinin family protein